MATAKLPAGYLLFFVMGWSQFGGSALPIIFLGGK